MPTVHQLKSSVGGHVRHGDLEGAEQARRALKLAMTEQTIRDAIEDAPELDPETAARIRALIPAAPSGDTPEAA